MNNLKGINLKATLSNELAREERHLAWLLVNIPKSKQAFKSKSKVFRLRAKLLVKMDD